MNTINNKNQITIPASMLVTEPKTEPQINTVVKHILPINQPRMFDPEIKPQMNEAGIPVLKAVPWRMHVPQINKVVEPIMPIEPQMIEPVMQQPVVKQVVKPKKM